MSSHPGLAEYASTLKLLNERFTPHAGQLGPGRALFAEGAKRLFLQMGRQSGKSTLMCHMAVRWAATHPNAKVYILGPFLNQMRGNVWTTGLLQGMCPPQLLDGAPNQTDGRIDFKNGSLIRVMGADNRESLRGLTASLYLIDEVKDVSPEVLNIIRPSLMVHQAPLVIAGTPPEIAEHPYWDLVNEAKSSPDWRHFHLPTSCSPYISAEELEKERQLHLARGDLDVFMREYMAEFVPGVKRAVFPMLSELEHVRPYSELWAKIYRNVEHWNFFCAMDPGTASVFASLLVAINPYTGMVYVMDEMYATSQMETSIGAIWPRIWEQIKQLNPPEKEDEWTYVVDEAATWARNELLDRYGVFARATTKSQNRKAEGLGLLKDLMLAGKLAISDRCVNLLREMKGYMLGENGQPVKRNDHAIDALRYALGASHYSALESDSPIPVIIPEDERRRAWKVEDDLAQIIGGVEGNYLLSSSFLDD